MQGNSRMTKTKRAVCRTATLGVSAPSYSDNSDIS